MTAAFSERFGRRPAYLVCFLINFGANLGLALQHNYTALLVLRCVQSSGSSGTVALAQGVLDDLTTSEQRGKFLAYMSIGFIMGPALGPVRLGSLGYHESNCLLLFLPGDRWPSIAISGLAINFLVSSDSRQHINAVNIDSLPGDQSIDRW